MGFELVELWKMEDWNVSMTAILIMMVRMNSVLMERLTSLGNWNVPVMVMTRMLGFQ